MNLIFEKIQNSDIIINKLMKHKELKENYDIIFNTNIGLCFTNKKCPLFISFSLPSNEYICYVIRFVKSISKNKDINLHSYCAKNILPLYDSTTLNSVNNMIDKIMHVIFSIFIEYEGYDIKYKSNSSYIHHYRMTYLTSVMNGFYKYFDSKIAPDDCCKIKDILIEKKNLESLNVFDANTNIFQINTYNIF